MPKSWTKYVGTESARRVIYLSWLLFLKLVFQISLIAQGFTSVSADEFARGIRAAKWAAQPQFNVLTDVSATWLPFEKYLNGLFLLLWPDVFWAPRVTVFIASFFVLVALFALVQYLFDSFVVAVLATTFVLFQPWYNWLSATPMLEMYYLACFLGGLFFLARWLKENRSGDWFWAGGCFLLASGFHVQSWTFINVVNLTTTPFLYQYLRRRQWGLILRSIGFYFLGNALILSFALIEFFNTGKVFAFLAKHTSYSKWYYGGYDISVLEKLSYYPNLVITHSSRVVWAFLIIALVFLLRDKAYKWKLFPLVLAIMTLVLNSVLNVLSGPPSAAPGRYSLWYVMMLSPYVAYGVCHAAAMGRQQWRSSLRYAPTVLVAGLFIYIVGWGLVRIPQFPRGLSKDAISTGYHLNQLLDQHEPDQVNRYMVELQYWDFIAVELTAGYYEAIVFDREADVLNRNTPSIFSGDTEAVCSNLATQHVRYVALRDPNLKANALLTGCLVAGQKIGQWTVYTFDSTSE